MSSHVVINSVPFATRLAHGAKNILARDRARAQKLLAGLHPHGPVVFQEARAARRAHPHSQNGASTVTYPPKLGAVAAGSGSIDVTDAGVTYTTPVAVGQPSTQFTLLIDTGSSNTWVGASTQYTPTSTSQNTGNTVSVSYGSGYFSGTEYIDYVSLGSGLNIPNQSIGVASTAQGFSGVDGILGIGPVDLTSGTVTNTSTVPTVTDNLYTQGTISTEEIGISYAPTASIGEINGELTFGGTDSTRYTGSIGYVPITTTLPAGYYWGIDQSLSYGSASPILTSSGIVDTGTTLLLIATDAFQAYQQATGATLDQTTGLLTITQQQYNNLQSLYFNIGGVTYELTPNAQIWPRALNSVIGGNSNAIYLVTADLGSPSGSGLDFIDGFVFLQRFYSVFDTTNSRVGFATTQYTNATTN